MGMIRNAQKRRYNEKVNAMTWKPIETAPKDGSYVLLSRAGLTTKSDKAIMPPTVGIWNANHRLVKQHTGKEGIYEGAWEGVDSGSVVLGRPVRWMLLVPDSGI